MAFFLNADETIYGRYGNRDEASAEDRQSLAGLAYAMNAALTAHRQVPDRNPIPGTQKPLQVEDYLGFARRRRGGCIHCHQVFEYRRKALQAEGKWQREDVWVYPQPENVGLTLDVDQGDLVRAVAPGSPAARAGLRVRDVVRTLNGMSVASIADLQYALHRAPAKGPVPISWRHDGQEKTSTLELAAGWRKTDLSWRTSMLDLLPWASLYGDDLRAEEKKALGLSAKRLAFRQRRPVHSQARAAGVLPDDVIIGIDGQVLEMTREEFQAHVHRSYLVGDRITLNVLRNGKRLDLPMTLR
jgi:predicted metalloprotease with PDZ domain